MADTNKKQRPSSLAEIQQIKKGEFDQELSLQLALELRAGFPSPAEDYHRDSLDFNRDMISHPDDTFYGRVRGDSMIGAGLDDGDIVVVDRRKEPHNGSIIVAYINNEFTIKYLDLTHKNDGYIELRPANDKYKPIRVTPDDDFRVWGVAIFNIKPFA